MGMYAIESVYYSTINSFGGLHLTKLLIIILIYSDYQNNASFNLLTLIFSLIYCSLANGNCTCSV